MMYCEACKAEVGSDDKACPSCGGDRIGVILQGRAAAVIAGAPFGAISIGYNPDRPWRQQWRTLRRRLEDVEAACAPDGRQGNEDVYERFGEFFLACHILADWLGDDANTGLTKKETRSAMGKDPALRIAAGISNTSKHHSRDSATAVTARISEIVTNGHGVQVTITWSAGSDSGQEDALDLARRCFAAWNAYIVGNGLALPS